MRIQHNIMAMNAYRNYNTNNSALSKNLEKLSSGYKINRAGDDAAGLAISEKMRAQITGLSKAQDNANDGISLVQTAEGALTEVHDMLNRMYSLAEQSANGTYENETDRTQLQKEVEQLKSEIDRIADATNFNGIKLLDGSLTGTTSSSSLSDVTVTSTQTAIVGTDGKKGSFEVDFSNFTVTNNSSAEQTVTINIGTFSFTAKISGGATMSGADILKQLTATTGSFVANGATFELKAEGNKLVATMESDPSSSATADQLKTQFAVSVTTATDMTHNNGLNANSTTITSAIKAEDSKLASGTFTLSGVEDGYTVKIGNESYTFAVGKDSKYKGMANVIDLTKYDGTETDFDNIAADALTKAASNNSMVTVGHNGSGTISLTEKKGQVDHDKFDLTKADGWEGFVQAGISTPATTTGGLVLQIGDTSDSYNQLNVSIQNCDTASLGIDTLNIGDQTSAKDALDTIKEAINYVSDVRGTLGATQNRLEHTINNLGVMEENIQNAESTIRDTDVAEEMMAYTKNNILIQSAQAMLAQANQVPQGVLQLLQ